MPALQILQAYLDEVGDACLRDDWETYVAAVELPFILMTQAATICISTQDELRIGFDAFCATLKHQRVTDHIRLAESAVDLDQGLISGRYTTHLLSGSHRIIPPYRSSITLRLAGNHWRAASISNDLVNTHWPLHLPQVGEDLLLKGTEE